MSGHSKSATPRTIYLALALLPLAAAAPFVGAFLQDHSAQGATQILGAFVEWVLAGFAVGAMGLACTVVGAWRGPRSGLTWLAVTLAALLCVATVTLAVLFFRTP